jgi:hypothetical protein
MIFKVHFHPTVKAREDTYISLCTKKLDTSNFEFNSFLYKHLFKYKILNFNYNNFSFDRPQSNIIKCFFVKEKRKLFCTLTHLVKPRKILEYSDITYAKEKLIQMIANRAVREVQEQEDAEVFAQINMDLYHPDNEGYYRAAQPVLQYPRVRPSMDYQGIARRALIVDPLPEGALPVYERDIDIDAIAFEEEDE